MPRIDSPLINKDCVATAESFRTTSAASKVCKWVDGWMDKLMVEWLGKSRCKPCTEVTQSHPDGSDQPGAFSKGAWIPGFLCTKL